MNSIAMVCHKYYPDIGGVETYVREISERLVKKGFDVEVICTDSAGKYPKHEYNNGVKITRFKALAPKNAFFFAPQVYFYLKNHRYDIIHGHNYHAFPALFASIATKGKFIFSPYYHGGSGSVLRNLMLGPYRRIGSYLFKKAEIVVCLSKYEMECIEKDFNISSSKFVQIPGGLNLDDFKEIEEIKKDSKVILYAGRLESYKGIQYLIKTLPLLPEYRLRIIGNGNYKKKLVDLAKKLEVIDRIDWLEHIERRQLLFELKAADVFVNLSTFESYGITVAEALACGTPCIVAAGGALEEFTDGEGCIGLDYPINIQTLAISIESMKKIPPRKMLDWEDVTTNLIRIYTS